MAPRQRRKVISGEGTKERQEHVILRALIAPLDGKGAPRRWTILEKGEKFVRQPAVDRAIDGHEVVFISYTEAEDDTEGESFMWTDEIKVVTTAGSPVDLMLTRVLHEAYAARPWCCSCGDHPAEISEDMDLYYDHEIDADRCAAQRMVDAVFDEDIPY